MVLPTRPPYEGLCRKLLIAIDIGTSSSGVSYSILEPGGIPEIRAVNKYPGQDCYGGFNIPSIIWYDKYGAVQAAGAEATREGIEIKAAQEGWSKAELFKIYLRPKTIQPIGELRKIPPLPPKKTVVHVFADFLRYLYVCTQTYFTESHANGRAIWSAFGEEIDFVLTHPNGYEGQQQSVLRKAAVLAGLVPNMKAGELRIHFVTEGEASLYYCIESGLAKDAMKEQKGMTIINAGGGTIDISSYVQKEDAFEEIAAPQCLYSGSVFVTSRAHIFFKNQLMESPSSKDMALITEKFDKETKPSFITDKRDYWIQFTSSSVEDAKYNIYEGQLRVSGADVASFFEPSISDIASSVEEQISSSRTEIKVSKGSRTFDPWLGGFAASQWLHNEVQERLDHLGTFVFCPDNSNQSVAHYATFYYLDHRVSKRVAKFTFGISCAFIYDPTNEEHAKRSHTKCQSPNGRCFIPRGFHVILPHGSQVAETKQFRRSYELSSDNLGSLRKRDLDVLCYRGKETPTWLDVHPEMFTSMCKIHVNLEGLTRTLRPILCTDGQGRLKTYYRIQCDIVLLFGMTEFKAFVAWKENGEEQRSSEVELLFEPEDVE